MRRAFRGISLTVLAGILSGCGGEITPENVPAEQKAADFGKKSQDEMNKMYPDMVKKTSKK